MMRTLNAFMPTKTKNSFDVLAVTEKDEQPKVDHAPPPPPSEVPRPPRRGQLRFAIACRCCPVAGERDLPCQAPEASDNTRDVQNGKKEGDTYDPRDLPEMK